MANAHSSAGVYVTEKDNSQFVSPASTSVGAMVGESNRGPVGQRTLVTSIKQFISTFGYPDASLGYLHHSALAFLNEGDRLYVTRVARNALYGGATVYIGENSLNVMEPWLDGLAIPTKYDFDLDDLFVIYAADPGLWNRDVRVRIYPNTKTNDDTFYVDVFEGVKAVPDETYLVTLDFRVDGYGVQMNLMQHINRRSSLIRIEQNYNQPDYVRNPAHRFVGALATVNLEGGSNGERATTGDFVQAWELYRDPEHVSVNMLVGAGLVQPSVQQRMDEICADRMDCMSILDVPQMEQKVQNALDFRRNVLSLNSNYSALYCCDLLVLDSYSGRRLYVPPSGYVAAAYARTDREYATWFAPAGLIRGALRVLGVRHKYNQGDRDMLVESQINPIRVIEGIGISIWGADTMQTMSSALSNVNVRRLMLFLEKSLSQAALYSVFDPNDEILRSALVEMCTRFLQPIQDGRGLHWFGVQCDDANNPPEVTAGGDLILDVLVDPVLPAKRILLQATINRTGARFTASTVDG